MKKGLILFSGAVFLGVLTGGAEQRAVQKLNLPGPAEAQISSVSQTHLPDDVEIVAHGVNFPTNVAFQLKYGPNLLTRGSTWNATTASGILPHTVVGARSYPVSISNGLTKQSASNSVDHFLLLYLNGLRPSTGISPGTRVRVLTPLAIENADGTLYVMFDDTKIWPGVDYQDEHGNVIFDIPGNVKVPSIHSVFLNRTGSGKARISNTITVNVTGLPTIKK